MQEEALAEATAGGEEDDEVVPELGLGLDKKKKKKKKREVSSAPCMSCEPFKSAL